MSGPMINKFNCLVPDLYFLKIQYLQTCEFGLDNPLLQIFYKLVNIFQIEVSKQVIIFP